MSVIIAAITPLLMRHARLILRDTPLIRYASYYYCHYAAAVVADTVDVAAAGDCYYIIRR